MAKPSPRKSEKLGMREPVWNHFKHYAIGLVDKDVLFLVPSRM